MIEEADGPAAFDLIVLAGSLPAGLGHGHSDVDLFVVTADGNPASDRMRFVGGVPVQLNNVRREEFEQFAETFDSYTVVPDDRSQLLARRQPFWTKLVTRLAYGRVLHASPDCAAYWARATRRCSACC